MYALIGISVIVFIIAIIVYAEYKNEKAYQEERKRRAEERKKVKPPYSPKEKLQKPLQKKKEISEKRKETVPGAKKRPAKTKTPKAEDVYALKEHPPVEKTKTAITEKEPVAPEKEKKVSKPAIKKEIPKKEEKKPELPSCKYPPFNYSRLIDMGLSEEEAIAFTKELIPQINAQIPLIKEAMEKKDYHQMERLTHSIKGSSTTVGTGGISDLLIECNTYLKSGTDPLIANAYFEHLVHYAKELERQFA